MERDSTDQKNNQEQKDPQNVESPDHGLLSVSSIADKSLVTKNRNKSIYLELLDRLRKDFNTRWDRKSVSSSKGLGDFIPIKTLGTGSFGRVKTHHNAYTAILNSLKKESLQRWHVHKVCSSKGLQEFTHIKTIGVGAFGSVLLVKRKENEGDAFYAMKVIDKSKIMALKQLDHTYYEKRILESIRYPFIINMEYCFKDNSYIYFVMPFVNGGEMFTHLRRMRRFTEILAKFYASQVVLSLEFLHYCDILYRDLKPENILIDAKGYIKIADLGFCKIVRGRTWTLCGTPEYIAPEVILSRGYGKAIDWWACGVLLYEMNAGFPPFSSADPMRIYEKIAMGKYKMPKIFSPDLQDLIKNLLQTDLTRRYGNLKNGVRDIKDHKWFKDIDWLAVYNRQIVPPFVPAVKMPNDTSNFNAFPEEKLKISDTVMFKEEFEGF